MKKTSKKVTAYRGGAARAPTVKDVAREAEVSAQTVSNALNQPDKLKPETLERVLTAIEAVGYSPSFAARALRAQSTKTIALVTLGDDESQHFDRPYFGRALNGVLRALEPRGYKTLIHESQSGDIASTIELFEHGRVDGAVILGASARGADITRLQESGYAIALLDRRGKSMPSASANYKAGMFRLTESVIEQGAARLVYFSGLCPRGSSGAARLAGFEGAVSQAGRRVKKSQIFETPWTIEGGRDAVHALGRQLKSVDALICASDDIALGALAEVKARGLSVPKDIRLTGFDASTPATVSEPPLTTVRVPIEDMAWQAATRLLALITGTLSSQGRHYVTQLDVLERGS